MRTIKDANERKNEILDIAEQLFKKKGYTQTTVDDILKESGIAKGTLYYHFKSKEDILLAMIERQVEERKNAMRAIAEDSSISAVEKVVRSIQHLSDSGLMADRIYVKGNAELHHTSFTLSLAAFSPIFTKIVEEGIESGVFATPYPQESVELLFCASELHDPQVFSWSDEERSRKKKAFYWMLELTLGMTDAAKAELYLLAGISQEGCDG
ncbi:MAG: TetR/AcrR family transcriptional regulator [Firmicutes bacterium]|nr:TetR/AcrR family transcriptional regulator [Bacillota bacterium]MCD8314174.1 TetR/AcrR family transcriptional regulator [Bacillota bacterium]